MPEVSVGVPQPHPGCVGQLSMWPGDEAEVEAVRPPTDSVDFVVRLHSDGLATVLTEGVDWHRVGVTRRLIEERIEGVCS